MITTDYISYGFRKIKPSELELRGYLYQFCGYTDKREFVEKSYEVVNYIESEGNDLYNLSEVPIDEIRGILKQFDILPNALYIHDSDKYANYDSTDFSKIIAHSLIEKNKSVIFDLDDIEEYPEGLTVDEIEKRKEKRRIREEKNDLINFLPTFYESLQEINMHEGKILIAYSVDGNIIDIFNETGNKLSIDEYEKEDEIDIDRESNSFISCKISHDKKSILLHFLDRISCWAIFEYNDKSFNFLKSERSFWDDNSPANYYLPNEIDAVYKKQMAQKEQLQNMPFSVTIGEQEWTTRNLETSYFRNGDPILEASSREEWEAAAESKIPAWCNYENNPVYGAKYGKLYNWYAVNDPRGLTPEGWHIPSIEEWDTLALTLGDNCNERIKNGEDWQPYHEMTDFLLRITQRIEGSNEDDQDDSNNEITSDKESKENSNEVSTLLLESMQGSSENDQGKKIVPPLFNDTGFTALPGGARGQFGNAFFAINDSAYWWTSSVLEDEEIDDQAYFVLLYEHDSTLQIGNSTDKKVGYSVRCIRNK